jgi:hypothetical protein
LIEELMNRVSTEPTSILGGGAKDIHVAACLSSSNMLTLEQIAALKLRAGDVMELD